MLRITGSRILLANCVVAAGLALVCGCTNRELYQAIQQNRQFECQNQLERPAKECAEATSEPYDKYKRERDELLKSGDSTP